MWGLIGIGLVALVLLGLVGAMEPSRRPKPGTDGDYEHNRFAGQAGYRNWRN